MMNRRRLLQKIGVVAAAPVALLAGEIPASARARSGDMQPLWDQPRNAIFVGKALPEGMSAEAMAEALRLAQSLGEFRP